MTTTSTNGTSTNGSLRASTRSLGKPSASYPGAIATDQHLAIAVDRQQTTLALAMGITDTSMTLSSAAQIVTWSLLSIDNEIVQVNGPPTGNVVPITRAWDGTTAAIHVPGTLVSGLVDAYHHNTLVAEIEAIENALGPNLSKVPTSPFLVNTAYIFTPQCPGGALTVGTNAITLSPVPGGINGTDVNHYLYISGGTGTPEAVLITGGSAVSGAPSGTIFVTCAYAHTGTWCIQTATGGIQEALILATTGVSVGINVVVAPGLYTMYGPITIPAGMSFAKLSGYGAIIQAATGYAFASMIKSTNNLATFTFEGLVIDANSLTGVSPVVDFTRPESSIRHNLNDITIQHVANGKTALTLDGCEDTTLTRYKSVAAAAGATYIVDVSWHVPAGNIRIENCTMFNLTIISAQMGMIANSTTGTIVSDTAGPTLTIIGNYMYATPYNGQVSNFYAINGGYFSSLSVTGCWLINSSATTVVFGAPFYAVNTLTGNEFVGVSGSTIFSSATTSNLGITTFMYNSPDEATSNVAQGTPGANVQVFTISGGNTIMPQPVTVGVGPNWIASETGANNAIAGSLPGVILKAGLAVKVFLAHTLQAGANTFAFNGGAPVSILRHTNGGNITIPYTVAAVIELVFTSGAWLDMSQ